MKSFNERAYDLLREVPKGKVTTYKEIANALGTSAYRAIGSAMKKNPYAPSVPCHRVVSSDGGIGGFNGCKEGKDITRKINMLMEEGIEFNGNKIKNFNDVIYRFI